MSILKRIFMIHGLFKNQILKELLSKDNEKKPTVIMALSQGMCIMKNVYLLRSQ